MLRDNVNKKQQDVWGCNGIHSEFNFTTNALSKCKGFLKSVPFKSDS